MSPRIEPPEPTRSHESREKEIRVTRSPNGDARWTWQKLDGIDVMIMFLGIGLGVMFPIDATVPTAILVGLLAIDGLALASVWINRRSVVEIRDGMLHVSRGYIPLPWSRQRLVLPLAEIIQVATSHNLVTDGGPDDTSGGLDTPTHMETCALLIQDAPDHFQRSIATLARYEWQPIIDAINEQIPPENGSHRIRDLDTIARTQRENRNVIVVLAVVLAVISLIVYRHYYPL